jgi:hypothetical protein
MLRPNRYLHSVTPAELNGSVFFFGIGQPSGNPICHSSV